MAQRVTVRNKVGAGNSGQWERAEPLGGALSLGQSAAPAERQQQQIMGEERGTYFFSPPYHPPAADHR